MISNHYYNNSNIKIPYIDISNSSSFLDDVTNPFIIRETKNSFNHFKVNEISLNLNNIGKKSLSTKKNLSNNFKILKNNTLNGKNKTFLDFSYFNFLANFFGFLR